MAGVTNRHASLLRAESVGLLVVDVQEGFRPVIDRFDDTVRNCRILIEGFSALNAPILISEQYPKGLGATIPELASVLPSGTPIVEKLRFSAIGVDGIDTALAATGRTHWVVCGIETHVCVAQTAQDLVAAGYHATIAADATSSRSPSNVTLGLEKCVRAGVEISSTEMILFEMLEVAGSDAFKAISKLVR